MALGELSVILAGARGYLLAKDNAASMAGGRVYSVFAPTSEDGQPPQMPYLLLTISTRLPNTERAVSLNGILNVQAVASGENDAGLAAAIAEAAFSDLEDAEDNLQLDSPWTLRVLELNEPYELPEVKDNTRFIIAGGLFRVEADKH